MCVAVIRRRPLCLRHFLKYAEHLESISLEYAKMQQSPPEPGVNSPPIRVQPGRAAKRKQGGSKAATTTGASRKGSAEQLFSVSEVRKGLETLVRAARNRDELQRECIFGQRPWICRQCEEQKRAEAAEKRSAWGPAGGGNAPYGEMDMDGQDGAGGPGSGSGSEPGWDSWETVSVPMDYQFRVGNVSFAVDACCEPMVMIL